MKQIVSIAIYLLLSTSAVAEDTETIHYFSYADQLIRQYHLMTGEPLPPVSSLTLDLVNISPSLRPLSSQYRSERDAFKKRELENRLTSALQESMKGQPAKAIAVYWQVQIEPYDFEKKQFSLCFGWYTCQQPPLYTKLGAQGYEIAAKESPTKINFAPDETTARLLESMASNTNRRLHALLIFQPSETKELKWSNGAPHRKIIANITDIYLLKSQTQNIDKLISPDNVIYKMSRLQ